MTVEVEQEVEPREAEELERVSLDKNNEIIFGNPIMIHPALDVIDGKKLIISIPMPGNITNKKGDIEQDTILVSVTAPGMIFLCSKDQFMNQGIQAKIPLTYPEYRWGADSFRKFYKGEASEVQPYDLYQKILERFQYFVDFDGIEFGASLCGVYAMGTYLYILSEYYPYLKVGGAKGVGKTKLGSIFSNLAFNACKSDNSTAPSIKRLVQDTRGTLIIDEAEGLAYRNSKSESQVATLQILNSGFNSTGITMVVNNDNHRIERFSTYGPKVICSIGGLENVLEDRCFEIILQRSLSKTISDRECRASSPEFGNIRDDLYLFDFQKWKEVKEILESLNSPPLRLEATGRDWNLAKLLIAIARLIDRYAPEGKKVIESEIIKFINADIKRKINSLQETETAIVLNAIYQMIKEMKGPDDYNHSITLKDISKKIEDIDESHKMKSRVISRVLRNTNLFHNPNKMHGVTGFSISKNELINQAERNRIQLENETEIEHSAPSTESPRFTPITGLTIEPDVSITIPNSTLQNEGKDADKEEEKKKKENPLGGLELEYYQDYYR